MCIQVIINNNFKHRQWGQCGYAVDKFKYVWNRELCLWAQKKSSNLCNQNENEIAAPTEIVSYSPPGLPEPPIFYISRSGQIPAPAPTPTPK